MTGAVPRDDRVDIALRVVMGALCHPVPVGNAPGADQNVVNLGYCTPDQAPVDDEPFTDGAPPCASDLGNAFP